MLFICRGALCHAPHHENLRIRRADVEVIAFALRKMQLHRQAGEAPAGACRIVNHSDRRMSWTVVAFDSGDAPLFVGPAVGKSDSLDDDCDRKPRGKHGLSNGGFRVDRSSYYSAAVARSVC